MADGKAGDVWSNKEKTALCQLKNKLQDLDLSNPIFEDRRLINWLRARDLSIEHAEKMLRAHLEWRQVNKIDTILTSDLVPVDDPIYTSLPVNIVGHDKQGNTIVVARAGDMDVKALVQAYPKETSMNFFHHLVETVYADIEHHSTDPNVFKKAVYICDMDGIRFKDYLSTDVLDFLITFLKVVEANYPELLYKAYVINAPFIFPVLWNILKPFMSPATLGKVEIIGRNQEKIQRALLEIISFEELPKIWGDGAGLPNKTSFALNKNNNMNILSSSSIKNTTSEGNFIETEISAGESFDISFQVENPKVLLSWTFKTVNYDIGFSLLHKPFHISNNSKSDKDCTTEKISYKRIDAQNDGVESGCLVCDVAGQYIFRFDNTYSRLRGKALLHHVEMTQLTTKENNGQ